MSRKLKLNRALIQKAAPLVKKGLLQNAIAAQLGISPQLLVGWLKKGAVDLDMGDTTPHAELVTAWRRAESEGQEELLDLLRESVNHPRSMDSKAVRWALERRWVGFRVAGAAQETNFETLSPEECEEQVLVKLQGFVSQHLKELERTATPEPTPAQPEAQEALPDGV